MTEQANVTSLLAVVRLYVSLDYGWNGPGAYYSGAALDDGQPKKTLHGFQFRR